MPATPTAIAHRMSLLIIGVYNLTQFCVSSGPSLKSTHSSFKMPTLLPQSTNMWIFPKDHPCGFQDSDSFNILLPVYNKFPYCDYLKTGAYLRIEDFNFWLHVILCQCSSLWFLRVNDLCNDMVLEFPEPCLLIIPPVTSIGSGGASVPWSLSWLDNISSWQLFHSLIFKYSSFSPLLPLFPAPFSNVSIHWFFYIFFLLAPLAFHHSVLKNQE